MTKTMNLVLGLLADGKPCYVMPATRRALMRAGLIAPVAPADRPIKRAGDANGYRFCVTAAGYASVGRTAPSVSP